MDPEQEWTSPPRDVPPPRPIPGSPGRRRRRTSAPGAELAHRAVDPALPDDAAESIGRAIDPEEPPWVRERREEAEFARQFGDWRGGGSGGSSRAPRRSRGTAVVPVLLLLVAVAVVLVAAL